MKHINSWFLCLCVPALLAGCRTTPSRVTSFNELATTAVNNYYNGEPSCLWFEPIALPTTDKPDGTMLLGLEALASQGVLTRTQDKQGLHFKVADAGRSFFRPDTQRPGFGNLCYGRPQLQRIVGTMTRRDDVFQDVTDVEYDSIISNAPAWTSSSVVRQAFPRMALEISRPLTHTATLKDTGHGWGVAAGPASAIPSGPAPR